ncbi:sigma-70 family RNA polymerase sigma factor [Lysinibacillus sp. BPa_S21]|uniref:sigma-70 family RNA polymerase sigma factor n=1 Tax=Lysinibacillus sp. BPa_S21 TaxID=2932478 RepID=UPI002013A315|nr:sigma-70 family RNA polymerase sigma factor [Lysinibacillus sp. BPa_S21]MCL1694295.1 sigma-70 family RNA polymerase sigma factor [Lysinibacillus sp. BPa_S21]
MQEILVQRAKEGDAEAFAQLFSQFEIDLYKMAYVYVGNEADALDVVQEVAYRSFKYIHSLQSVTYVKTWLMRIVINCASDLLKKRGQNRPFEAELEIGEESLEELPEKWALEDVMAKLTKEEKDVILLRFYHDYTLSQVAQVLQLKLGTTKTILYRALKKLKQALEQEVQE